MPSLPNLKALLSLVFVLAAQAIYTLPALPQSKVKVVSLAPSNTELLASIGALDSLVGVSTYCDYPPAALQKPKVGTFVSANLERLTAIKPDYVLLVAGQEGLDASLRHNKFKTILLRNDNLTDIENNIKSLGKLTAHEETAQKEAQVFAQRLTAFNTTIGKAQSKPKVFFCVWPQPLLTVGKTSFLHQAITVCGGINIAADMTKAYPNMSLEKLVLANPDVIILPYEARNQTILTKSPWTSLRAVKEKKVYYLPDAKKDMLARPTTRVIDGLNWLAERIHPELYTK